MSDWRLQLRLRCATCDWCTTLRPSVTPTFTLNTAPHTVNWRVFGLFSYITTRFITNTTSYCNSRLSSWHSVTAAPTTQLATSTTTQQTWRRVQLPSTRSSCGIHNHLLNKSASVRLCDYILVWRVLKFFYLALGGASSWRWLGESTFYWCYC